MTSQKPYLPYLALVVTTLSWGTAFVASKVVLSYWPAWGFMFMRFTGGSILFFFLLLFRGELRLPKGSLKYLALLGLFQPSLYFVFETLGLERTSAASVSIIIAAIPAVVALSSGFFLSEHLSPRGWFGAGLSMVGIVFIALFDRSGGLGQSTLIGNVLTFGAVISAAVYTILTRKLSRSIKTLQITGYQMFFAALFFLPGGILQGKELIAVSLTIELLVAFGFLVVGATLAAFLCFNFALKHIPAPRASIYLNGIPVVTVFAAWLILGEDLNMIQTIGGVMSITGVVLAGKKANPAPVIEA